MARSYGKNAKDNIANQEDDKTYKIHNIAISK